MFVKNPSFTSLSPVTYIRMAALVAVVASLCGTAKFWSNGKRKKKRNEQEMQEMAEKKDAEIAGLQRTLDETRGQLQARDDAIAVLKTQTDRLKEESFDAQKQLQTALAQIQTKEVAVGVLKTQADHLKADLADAQRELQEARNEAARVGTELVALQERAIHNRRELNAIREKHEQTQELLMARSAELKAAQTFLTTTDKLSNVDVAHLVDALNAEILQVSALIADAFTFGAKNGNGVVESEEIDESLARATETVGPRMVHLLMSSEHNEDPILVQIAFQGGLCAYVQWIISSWYFESPDNEQLLRDVYYHIKDSEEQAIYGRWRALTRRHVHQMIGDGPDLTVYFLDAFVTILVAAGLNESQSQIAETIQSRFSAEIERIIKKSQGLKRVLGEDVMSCELEILYIEPEHPFDEKLMEDTFQDQSARDNLEDTEGVLCTTDLGLIRHEKNRDTAGGWKDSVLLKPKIVLESKLNDIVAGDEDS
ncbi:hypothetical protein AX15_003174 [Amanita polypyramis BW_CC]|nr:hypothetical protein AX15_003174 [Amanita polypyramis BW_CC]